jgi:hypothetical protein
MTTVLVVDDEPQIARTLRINLTARGYEVITAADGVRGDVGRRDEDSFAPGRHGRFVADLEFDLGQEVGGLVEL